MCKLGRYSSRISFRRCIAQILFNRCDSEIEVDIFLISFPFLLSLLPCCDFQMMSKMQRHQQEALWEFVHTELTYVNKLVIIKDGELNVHPATPELLFFNLPSILSAHQLFWQEVIFPMLHEVRRTGMPFDPVSLEAGLECNYVFSHLRYFHTWVETHPQSQRMRLGDMQAKPHQRITKYPLLLKAVLKTTQDPHVQHKLRGMLSSVNSFLDSINDYLRLKDEELALTISAQRVEGYEVEGINEEIDKVKYKYICQFDLTRPIRGVEPRVVRKLLLEENLKIRGRKDSKLEVVALLFSDVLLMTKVPKKGERLRVVRPPLALDRTYLPPSPSFSTTPSPSLSDGDRDTEWEEEVELMRHRALTVSEGWKEQLVDGDDDDKRNRCV
uniref:DH domain-containing protein n=1 Tax=Mola mola TaxID=94237 RepID=A0A3Q4BLF2_MOLML